MFDTNGFPVDLVLLGLVALFLVLRLRSVLGRRTGLERQAEPTGRAGVRGGPVIEGKAEPAPPPAPERAIPDLETPLGQTLAGMRRFDSAFTPGRFLANAEAAFRLVVSAFAAGDREKLRPLLGEAAFAAFEGAIASREAAGETLRCEIRAITTAAIKAAWLEGSHATITVRFVSDQVNVTTGRDGQPVSGVDGITEIADLWTFERELRRSEPTWRLTAAQSA